MEPEAAAALQAFFEQYSPASALGDIHVSAAITAWFGRGSEEQFWALAPPKFRPQCDCVSRQALRVSQAHGDKPPQAEVKTLSPELLQGIWADQHEPERFEISGLPPEMHAARAHTLFKRLGFAENNKLSIRFMERVGTLLYGHEIDQIILSGNLTVRRGQNEVSVALDEVARWHNTDREALRKIWRDIPPEDIGGFLNIYRKDGFPEIEKQSRGLDNIALVLIRRGCTIVGLTKDIIATRDTPLTSWICKMTAQGPDNGFDMPQQVPQLPSATRPLDSQTLQKHTSNPSLPGAHFQQARWRIGSEMQTALHDSLPEGSEDGRSSTPTVENSESRELIPSQQPVRSTTETSMHASKRRKFSEKDTQRQEVTRFVPTTGTSTLSPSELSMEPQCQFSEGSGGARGMETRYVQPKDLYLSSYGISDLFDESSDDFSHL
ncbi:hypothetical protein PSPO01_16449 [Paraphaeosphaeria sporulosa]